MTKRAWKSRAAGSDVSSEPSDEQPKVIILLSETDSTDQVAIRKALESGARERSISILKSIRPEIIRVTSGMEKDRYVPILKHADATWIYREIHRHNTAVLALGSILVRRDPSQHPTRRRSLLTAERYLRYKAYYGMIRTKRDVSFHLDGFVDSLGVVDCDGSDDPRVLPMHSFNCPNEWSALRDVTEQQRFITEHGTSSRRSDCDGLLWGKPKGQAGRHGGPALVVGRCWLEQGFHWDVSASGTGVLYTSNAVWKLSGKRGYLNVYPDGHVRKTETSTAKLVWSS